jgi:hypothetical protein
MMKLDAMYLNDVLEQDELLNDFSFHQILRRVEYELKMISYGKRNKSSKETFNKLSYLAGI